MNSSIEPSVIIERLKGDRKLYARRQQKDLEEKVAVGRVVVAEKFERHCAHVDDSRQALALAWHDTVEDSLKQKSKENAVLQGKIRSLERELMESKRMTEAAEMEIERVEAINHLEELDVVETERASIQQQFEKAKNVYLKELQDRDIEVEELRREVIEKGMRCKRLEQENTRLVAFFSTLEEEGGAVEELSKQLRLELVLHDHESRKHHGLNVKYESLVCRFQALVAENLALKEEYVAHHGAPLVPLGTLERLGTPVGTLKHVNEREVEWRISNFFDLMDKATEKAFLISDTFELDGMPLKFELQPKRGKQTPACFFSVKHAHQNSQPRIAVHLSIGEQMFTTFLPLRPNEERPWVDSADVRREIDLSGVITFSLEFVELCEDVIEETDGKAVWKVGKDKMTLYGTQWLSMGMSPLFSVNDVNLQMELFPAGEDEDSPGCCVTVFSPGEKSLQYVLDVSGVGDVCGMAWASSERQQNSHYFDVACDDSETTISIRLLSK